MSRSTIIISVALGVAAVAAGAALALGVFYDPSPATATAPKVAVTVTSTPTAPRPVTFVKGSPEYEQLLACVFKAGYRSSYVGDDTTVPSVHFTGKGLPEINFRVDATAKPRTITPEAGRDTVLLQTAGCL